MTDDEAAWILGQIVEKLRGCPAGAIRRLAESEPDDNVMIRVQATLRSTDGPPLRLQLTIQHTENAPGAAEPAIPAEFFDRSSDVQN